MLDFFITTLTLVLLFFCTVVYSRHDIYEYYKEQLDMKILKDPINSYKKEKELLYEFKYLIDYLDGMFK
jgi:hypothetical protein